MSGTNKEVILIPYDNCIIIEIEKVEETTAGGIYLSRDMVDRDQMSITQGYLAKVGDFAFYDTIQNNKKYPKVGDLIFFKRHSGIFQFEEKFDPESGLDRVFVTIRDEDIYDWIDKQSEINVEQIIDTNIQE